VLIKQGAYLQVSYHEPDYSSWDLTATRQHATQHHSDPFSDHAVPKQREETASAGSKAASVFPSSIRRYGNPPEQVFRNKRTTTPTSSDDFSQAFRDRTPSTKKADFLSLTSRTYSDSAYNSLSRVTRTEGFDPSEAWTADSSFESTKMGSPSLSSPPSSNQSFLQNDTREQSHSFMTGSRTTESFSPVGGDTEALSPIYRLISPSANQVRLDLIANGIDHRTTIMLRNVPNKIDQKMLVEYLDETSANEYDFVYLRIDFMVRKHECAKSRINATWDTPLSISWIQCRSYTLQSLESIHGGTNSILRRSVILHMPIFRVRAA